jgi:transcriptional regulator with XRE-family HTH domain
LLFYNCQNILWHFSHIAFVNKNRNIEYINAFSQNLRRIRQKKNFTMLELAFEADVEYSQIAKIERGISNPTISTVYILAKALNVKVVDLFKFQDQEE